MITRVERWGDSLAVPIPGIYAEELHLEEGMQFEVSPFDGGLLLKPLRPSYTLAELLAGITQENLHRTTEWGRTQGNEVW